ncbi:MarR family transcriptional regulator [Aquibium carbonis]|uniref:MarR family transcriptional regulator n=1 Tax=Aquibium carbonis TaxID=2495581 RepID=A0A3R9Y9U1_9HYPH|nr:MarR family transcriptional regulator [Aquibium carbonis]RST82827.1 MarR family transcriptional regulator [Aquibium carbonis]
MDRIEDCISFLLGKATQQVARRSRDALAPFGVTPVQFAALRILWERDGQSCAEMGARLLLDSATMTGIVDRLETAGLVERRPDPEGDRRINRIYLGDEGRARCRSMNAAMDGVNAEVDRILGQRTPGLRQALALLGEVEPRAAEPTDRSPG